MLLQQSLVNYFSLFLSQRALYLGTVVLTLQHDHGYIFLGLYSDVTHLWI